MKGRAPYPPERTLLTTGIIDAVMESRVAGNGRLLTPHLLALLTSLYALMLSTLRLWYTSGTSPTNTGSTIRMNCLKSRVH